MRFNRKEKAVYWAWEGINELGEPMVVAPVEVSVRIEDYEQDVLSPTGEVVKSPIRMSVDREMVVGSYLWEGELTDVPDPVVEAYQVIDYKEVPNLKGVVVDRWVTLIYALQPVLDVYDQAPTLPDPNDPTDPNPDPLPEPPPPLPEPDDPDPPPVITPDPEPDPPDPDPPDPPPVVCPVSLVTALSADTAPDNPSIVDVTVAYTLSDPSVVATTETLAIEPSVSANTTQSLPINARSLDFSAYAGETVTVRYTVTYRCNDFETLSSEKTADVVVPAFTNEIVVDAAAGAGYTHTTISDGIDAVSTGGRITIRAGTYTISQNGEDSIFSFNSKQNITVVGASMATTILQGSNSANNPVIRNGSSQDCMFKNFTVTGGGRWGWYMEDAVRTKLENIHITQTDRDTTDNVSLGYYLDGADRTELLNCEASYTDGTNISFIGMTRNSYIYNMDCHHADRFGLLIKENSSNNTVQGGTFRDNISSGIVCGEPGNTGTLLYDVNVYDNGAAGIQMENGCNNFEIRRATIYGNNGGVGKNGEAPLWLDDNLMGLVEDCIMYGNSAGLRISSNEFAESDHDIEFSVRKVIFRGNRVYDNTLENNGDVNSNQLQNCVNVYGYNNTFSGNGQNSSNNGINGIFIRKRDPDHTVSNLTALSNHNATDEDLVFVTANNGTYLYFDDDRSNQTIDGYTYVNGPGSDDYYLRLVPNANLIWKNNIVQNVVNNSDSSARTMRIDDLGGIADINNNIYYNGPNSNSYEVGGTTYSTFAAYQSAVGSHESASQEADPLLDSNLDPQTGSPALGAAAALTSISDISGTTIYMYHPRMFWVGDRIRFQDGTTALISAVNDTNVVVDAVPVTVSTGQPVHLYRANGSSDIGAWAAA